MVFALWCGLGGVGGGFTSYFFITIDKAFDESPSKCLKHRSELQM